MLVKKDVAIYKIIDGDLFVLPINHHINATYLGINLSYRRTLGNFYMPLIADNQPLNYEK